MTLERIDPELLELVPSLARWAPPAAIIDTRVYSPFVERALLGDLREHAAAAIVITGAEADVRALAAVLSTVDLGTG